MWLVVGLGNPGRKYARTRHNIGFFVVEAVASMHDITLSERTDYRTGSGSIGTEKVILMEPLTFMNRSGVAVRKVAAKPGLDPAHIIVVHDDLDLVTGQIKIRFRGSSGGHRGVESIIQHLGVREFIRVKIGIGRDQHVPVEDYVLSNFSRSEQTIVREAVAGAADAIGCIITEGIQKAMNRFN